MAPISDVRERVIASRLPGPSSLSLWRISAIGEIYGLFLLYWVRTGMERIYSSPRNKSFSPQFAQWLQRIQDIGYRGENGSIGFT
jgi:hypothetical protein